VRGVPTYTSQDLAIHDLANRWLFPIGALLTDDEARCAIGACAWRATRRST